MPAAGEVVGGRVKGLQRLSQDMTEHSQMFKVEQDTYHWDYDERKELPETFMLSKRHPETKELSQVGTYTIDTTGKFTVNMLPDFEDEGKGIDAFFNPPEE